MSAGTSDEVMIYFVCQQTFMQFLVHFKEEVAFATINNQGQIPIRQFINLIDYCMIVLYRLVGSELSQLFLHLPVVGKRANIHSAACASRRPEHIFMADSIP